MKRIDQNETPEVVARFMADMAEHIENQKSELERLRAEQSKKDQQSFTIEEELKLIRRSIFGRSSEKRVDATDRPRTRSQTENLLFSQAMFPGIEVKDESGQTIKNRWADLESQEVVVAIHESEFADEGRVRGIDKHHLEKWSDLWEEIPNAFESVTKIEIIERRYVKKIFRKKKYKLKEEYKCQVDDKDVILTASVPGLLPGMNYTTNFVAAVVADKYISHIPLERQVRQME